MIRVTVLLLEGGLPSTFITPIEIFGSAGVLWNTITGEAGDPFFHVRTASLDGKGVHTSTSLAVEPDCSVEDVDPTDLVFVTGTQPDLAAALTANAALLPWLQRWREGGAAIAGVCTGVSLLAETGLLDGRPATTHWAFESFCRQRHPRVQWQIEHLVTESDRIFCGGGGYASIDLSLYLVEKYCGHTVALHTAKALLLQMPRVWQAGYAADPPHASHGDAQIQRAQEWLFRNLAQSVQVEELAAQVCMSPRTFARRFKTATGDTPINYLHRLRINTAKHLLENDLKSIRQVSRAVGYEDLTFFRRLFKRYTGMPPREYRERFGSKSPPRVALVGSTSRVRARVESPRESVRQGNWSRASRTA